MPGTFIFDGPPGMAPQVGSQVSLRAACESFDAQPGYYFVFGETLDELADQLSLTRLYFHCPAEGAARLVGELTGMLNRFQTPFQMKTPTAPALYGRTDAAVLYVAQRYFPIAIPHRLACPRENIRFEAATPLFAKMLWPGIGAAVEPELQAKASAPHRCRLAAEGIVNAWRQGEQGGGGAPRRGRAKISGEAASTRSARGSARTATDPFELPQTARLP